METTLELLLHALVAALVVEILLMGLTQRIKGKDGK
jgi:hypothetical protein